MIYQMLMHLTQWQSITINISSGNKLRLKCGRRQWEAVEWPWQTILLQLAEPDEVIVFQRLILSCFCV